MSKIYQNTLPWIEKYRPNKLNDIISQEIIIETLKNFISNNELPHLLFHGPPGTGKTTVVMSLAKILYKENINVMTMIINASEERGIEVVRNRIMQFANSKNMLFQDDNDKMFKLIILDEVDAMTPDAQASLRRVIEKYTKNVRFCLICNYIKKIDIAIQSRCTCFRFAPLKKKYIKQKILEIAEKENIKYTKSGIDTIIQRSNGDMRKVLNILQSVSMGYKNVNEKNVNKCLGYPCKKDVEYILNTIANYNFKETYELLYDFKTKNGFSINDIISEIHSYLISYLNKKNKKNIIKFTNEQILHIIKYMGDIEYNIANVNDETIQFAAFISVFKF